MIVDTFAKSLEESVYYKLEEEILTGVLKPAEALAETALSKRLGVSRTPIRGALHRLEKEGLVEISPNRGAIVVGVSPEDLVDIYRIRMRLEGLASREAAKRISEEELERLREAVELSEFYIARKDAEHLKELDTEFHSIIYHASGNRLLYNILSDLHRNIRAYRKLSLSVPERLESSIREHREILSAIERGDTDGADRLTADHIRAALDNLLTVAGKTQ